MPGSLIKIDEFTISSAVASVILGGGSAGSSGLNVSIDDTYDVYMVRIHSLEVDTDQRDIKIRFTESGTPNTTAAYNVAQQNLNSNQAFDRQNSTAQTTFDLSLNIGNSTGEQFHSVQYIFQARNSSSFTFLTQENTMMSDQAELRGKQGGGLFAVSSLVDGIQYIGNSTNIDRGTFVLYGLKKS